MKQNGNLNTATQTGTNVTTNTAKIYQEGMSNTATQILAGTNNGYYGGVYPNERVLINQVGEGNAATQNFTGRGSSHGNSADIQQIGDRNFAVQVGNGRNIFAEFVQNGNDNRAESNQDGQEQQVFANQDGDGNIITFMQEGSNNLAKIFQDGDMNMGSVTQTGMGNIGTITQTGNMNQALITQSN